MKWCVPTPVLNIWVCAPNQQFRSTFPTVALDHDAQGGVSAKTRGVDVVSPLLEQEVDDLRCLGPVELGSAIFGTTGLPLLTVLLKNGLRSSTRVKSNIDSLHKKL